MLKSQGVPLTIIFGCFTGVALLSLLVVLCLLGPVALAVVKRAVPVEAVLSVAGVPASQEPSPPPFHCPAPSCALRRPREPGKSTQGDV